MCGRFALFASAEELERHFQVPLPFAVTPRYNIAPSQPVLALATSTDAPEPVWIHFRWGMVPRWAKDPARGNQMINARCESLHEKLAFRSAFRHRRCILPMSGFYEWAKVGAKRQPYFVKPATDSVMGVAGLWEPWQSPDGAALTTCTIITTGANATVRPLHPRMVVVLDPATYALWLDPSTPVEALKTLLRPAPETLLTAYPVGTRVNNPTHDAPLLIEPLSPELTLFEGG